MPLTAAQWRDREAFLVDLQSTRRAIAEVTQNATEALNRINTRSEAADVVRALQQQLRTLRRSANNLASEFNGNGVRQGSLYGPTESHRDRKRRIDRSLDELRAALSEAVGR